MAILQITNKEIDLESNTITLTAIDTSYVEQTRLIGADEGITLETVASGDNFETGLLQNIKYKQDLLKTKFDAYIERINEYAATWDFGTIPFFTTYIYTFTTLGSEINKDKPANNSLKNRLVQNELYLSEARNKISAALWWLKTKHKERLIMALCSLKISANTINTLHGNQRILATKEINSIYDGSGGGLLANLISSGDYKKVRTPGITGYDPSGGLDFSIIIETGAQYEYIASATYPTAPPTPDNASPVSTGAAITSSAAYLRIKYRFPNGIVAEALYKRGVNASGIQTGDITITQAGSRLTNVTGNTLYYTLDGTKPNMTSATIASGAHIDVPASAISDIGLVRISKAISADAELPYDADMKFILPWSYDSGAKTFITFYDLLDKNNKYLAAIGAVPTSLTFTLDGKMLIVNGTDYYDTEDWGISPIYKPYDMLTLDDLIRVYP